MKRLLPLVLLLAVGAGRAAADVVEAELAWERGDRREAGRLIREDVAAHPDDARAPRVAALLARTAMDPAEALGRWEEVLALEPDGALAAEAHWAKGMHAYSAGLYVAAAHEFAVLAERFGSHVDEGRALLWKARSELGAGKPAVAESTFDEARRRAHAGVDRRGAELGLAHAAFQTGNAEEALRRYDRFERQHPDDGRASAAARRAVECLKLLGRVEEASARAARIERDYPNSTEATLTRAETRRVEAPPEPPPVEKAPGPFVVQVASMADLRNAVALRREIRALGIDGVRIEMTEGRTGAMHRVLLGPYDTEPEARAVADSCATIGDLNPRVREVTE